MLGRNKGSFILYFIVGLASIGLVTSLIKNPGGFLMSIFFMIGIAFVIFMIMRAVLNRRSGGNSDEMKKYKQAVRRSKVKYTKEKPDVRKQISGASSKRKSTSNSKYKRKRRHGPHLTVIEGKKSTDKNKDDRASN